MMKRSVRKPTVFGEYRVVVKPVLVAMTIVMAISWLFDVSAAVFQLLCFAALPACVVVATRPPWFERSPIGRWLRRW